MTRLTDRLARNVKSERESAGLSQEALARLAGVAAATISRIERGATKNPREDELGRIAAALGTSIDLLMGLLDGESSPETDGVPDVEAAIRHHVPNRTDALLLASVAKDWEDLDEGDQAVIRAAANAAHQRRIRAQQQAEREKQGRG